MRMLGKFGCKVSLVPNGIGKRAPHNSSYNFFCRITEACTAVWNEKFDIILMDLHMYVYILVRFVLDSCTLFNPMKAWDGRMGGSAKDQRRSTTKPSGTYLCNDRWYPRFQGGNERSSGVSCEAVHLERFGSSSMSACHAGLSSQRRRIGKLSFKPGVFL